MAFDSIMIIIITIIDNGGGETRCFLLLGEIDILSTCCCRLGTNDSITTNQYS